MPSLAARGQSSAAPWWHRAAGAGAVRQLPPPLGANRRVPRGVPAHGRCWRWRSAGQVCGRWPGRPGETAVAASAAAAVAGAAVCNCCSHWLALARSLSGRAKAALRARCSSFTVYGFRPGGLAQCQRTSGGKNGQGVAHIQPSVVAITGPEVCNASAEGRTSAAAYACTGPVTRFITSAFRR